MTTVLYADVLFIINFSMDFISLCITAKMLSIRRKTVPYTVSAVIGAVFATAIVALGISAAAEVGLTVLVSVIMCIVAYGFGSVLTLAVRTFALWGTGTLIGGAVSVICSFGENNVIPENPESDFSSAMSVFILGGVCAAYIFVRIMRPKIRSKQTDITVSCDGNSITVTALVDSGNLCTEPISGKSVIFLSRIDTEKLIGREDTEAILHGDRINLSEKMMRRFRVIFANGGVVYGFCPDRVDVVSGKNKSDCAVICAVTDVGKNYYGGNGALVPSAIL